MNFAKYLMKKWQDGRVNSGSFFAEAWKIQGLSISNRIRRNIRGSDK